MVMVLSLARAECAYLKEIISSSVHMSLSSDCLPACLFQRDVEALCSHEERG